MGSVGNEQYVTLNGTQSDEFIETYHNKSLIGSRNANTMDGAQAGRLNKPLRQGEMPTDEKDLKLMDRLDKAIQKNEIPQNMTVFRGITVSNFQSTFGDLHVFDDYLKNKQSIQFTEYRNADGSVNWDAYNKASERVDKHNNDLLLKASKQLIGKTFTDKGYMMVSASPDRNIFTFSDITLALQTPKGTKAYISNYKEESEMIFGRNTHFEVTSTRIKKVKADNGNTGTTLELLGKLVRR